VIKGGLPFRLGTACEMMTAFMLSSSLTLKLQQSIYYRPRLVRRMPGIAKPY
jgi:hypothetical protein